MIMVTFILLWSNIYATWLFRLQEIKNKVFTPFELIDNFNIPFSDIDPDYQY